MDSTNSTMEVQIDDEANGRLITVWLTPAQYERAQRDSGYLNQLIQDNTVNNAEDQSSSNNNDPAEDQSRSDNPDSRSVFIWNDQCIHLLLSLYEEHKEDFNNKRHKIIFESISKKMKETNPNYDVTGSQCQSKIISLKKTFKKISDHNSTSGNDRASWPYFDRMNELFGATGWANPVALASELGPTTQENETPGTPETRPKKRKIDSVLEELRKDISKYSEERARAKQENFVKLMEQKQRQHEEKMEILRQLLPNRQV